MAKKEHDFGSMWGKSQKVIGVVREFKPDPNNYSKITKIDPSMTDIILTDPTSGVVGTVSKMVIFTRPMPTLAQYKAGLEKTQREKNEDHVNRCKALLAQLEAADIPVFKTEDGSRYQNTIRKQLQDGAVTFTGIACDHCGTELANRNPGNGSDPRILLGCPGCGWIGWVDLENVPWPA